MTAQIRTASLSEEQAAVVDTLALKLGGVSKAVQHIIDAYAIEDDEVLLSPKTTAGKNVLPEETLT